MKKLLAVLMTILSLSACGGGGGSTGSGSAALTSVEIIVPKTTLTSGDRMRLDKIGIYSDGSRRFVSVDWSVSNNNASIFANDLTAEKAGTVEVIAIESFTRIAARLTITINPSSPTAININGFEKDKIKYSSKDKRTLTATAVHPEASSVAITSTVTWLSSNTGVATVDANGGFAAVAPGNVTITASALGFTKSVNIDILLVESNPIIIKCGINPIPANQVSRADWGAKLANDEQNGSEWLQFDKTTCTRDFVALYVKKPEDDSYTTLINGIRRNGVVYTSRVFNNIGPDQTEAAVGNKLSEISIFFNLENAFTIFP